MGFAPALFNSLEYDVVWAECDLVVGCILIGMHFS